MAIQDNFIGLSFEFDESLSQFQGITFELTENLIVKVVDANGQAVNGAEVFFTIGQETESGITEVNGTFGYLVEEQNTVTVSAQFECLFTEEVDIVHNGIDDFRSITLTLQELPCLNPDSLNDYNFIRWQLSNNLVLPLEERPIKACVGCDEDEEQLLGFNGVSRPRASGDCEVYRPIMRNGEKLSFFTNFLMDIEFGQKITAKIGLIKENALDISASYDVDFITVNGVDYFYGSIIPEGINNGIYRLVVFNDVTKVIYIVSNEIEVDNQVDLRTTALAKYRNNDLIDGYRYNDLPDFYNQVRIAIFRDQPSESEPDYEDEDQVATAEHRYISLAQRKKIPLVADQFDELAKNALESMLAHSEVYFNGKRYNCKPEVDAEQADESHNLYDLRFNVYDYSYARKNKYQ